MGSVREGIETVNRGIYSLIYMHYFPLFLLCGTMFPHGLTCEGRVATYRTSDAIRTVTIAWTRVHAIVKSITCAKGDLSEDNRTTYLAPRGILRSSRSASIEGLELIAIGRLIFIERQSRSDG